MHRRLLTVFLALAAGTNVSAQQITRYTIDGGGGSSQAGSFVLRGSVGQPDAGRVSAPGYVLRGGFWAAGGDRIFATAFEIL